MHKSLTAVVLSILAAGMMLSGYARGQQTPAAQSSQPAAKPATKASGTQSTAKKAPATAAKSTFALKTQKEKASYALGMNIGSGLHRQGIPVDAAIVARGLRDAMGSGKTLMTEEEMKATLQQLSAEVHKAQDAKLHAAGEASRKEAEAFLTANKAKPGVTALSDGLQYKILKEGTGPKPTASDTVSVNYKGSLLNGTEFDSSYKRGQPASFPVGGVIKGWTEALQLMPVGSKWELYIPADLAYGDNPPPGSGIAPGSTLVFEVELLSIGEEKK